MKNNKRRLLKDLPFDNLEKGDVIYNGGRGRGGRFSVSHGKTYYETGGSSDKGIQGFNNLVEDILEEIWDNPEWFEDADLSHVDVIPSTTSITLRFKSIDRDEAEEFARGVIHVLKHLGDDSYVWNKFNGITTTIRNQ